MEKSRGNIFFFWKRLNSSLSGKTFQGIFCQYLQKKLQQQYNSKLLKLRWKCKKPDKFLCYNFSSIMRKNLPSRPIQVPCCCHFKDLVLKNSLLRLSFVSFLLEFIVAKQVSLFSKVVSIFFTIQNARITETVHFVMQQTQGKFNSGKKLSLEVWDS